MQMIGEVIEVGGDKYSDGFCPLRDSCIHLFEALREKEKVIAENEKLREVFQIGVREFEKRNNKIAELEATIKKLREENRELQKRIERLEGKNNLLKKIAFGKSSEKEGDEKFKTGGGKRRGAVERHKGYGRKIPENLPVREEIIDLADDEKFCSCCGSPYMETGLEEVSCEVCVEKVYYLKKIKRKVYKKTCPCPNPIITTPPPPKLIPRGKFSLLFWVDVLINKYRNHLPIERQVSGMREYGLSVSTGTIFGGLKNIYDLYLQRLYEAMKRVIKEASHIHADESGWRLFVKMDGKDNYNLFMWVFISKDIVLFVLDKTRSARVPFKTLFDIEIEEAKMLESTTLIDSKKIMNVDKFSAYKMLERLGFVELAFCWTHQRREFIDLNTKYPQFSSWAEEWIKRIATLYHINNERIKYTPADPLFKEYDQRLREELKEIHSFNHEEYSHPAQQGIMNSMKRHWKGLTLFVDNPQIPMDNNLAERTFRPMVLGRNNYWGNHSLWAGELTATMFSTVQTSFLNEISPRAYLTYYLKECAKRGSAPSDDEIEAFLPHRLNEDIKRELKIFK